MKYLFLLLFVLLVSGCLEDSQNEKSKLVDDNSYVSGKLLPRDATNKKYIGNGWFTFKLYGECFMYNDKGRSSVMSNVRCR